MKKKQSRKCLHGEVSKWGYKIMGPCPFSASLSGVLYEAGNHPRDSFQTIDPADKDAIPISELLKFCETTGSDMAKEMGMKWKGVHKSDSYPST